MGSRVELFEQIRRDRDREGLSIRALAERHGVHRRAVRQALVSPVPPAKRSPRGQPAPKLGAYRALIDAWLEGDREAPRKQRHTAKRIWRRLVDEHGADVAETTVRDYVRSRKRALGWRSARCSFRRSRRPACWRRSTGARRRSSWPASRRGCICF
jgi:transcriptional regulator with XRE-family HTH domain